MAAPDFLGKGLVAPLRRDGKGDFKSASGLELIGSSVFTILGTIAQSDFTLGELPWRTEFGSLLTQLRHRNNDAIQREFADALSIQALKEQEPRIAVTSTDIVSEENQLTVKVKTRIIGFNVEANQIFTGVPIIIS